MYLKFVHMVSHVLCRESNFIEYSGMICVWKALLLRISYKKGVPIMYTSISSPIQRIQQKLLSHNIDQHESISVGCEWPAHQTYGGRAETESVPGGGGGTVQQ